MTHEQYAYWLAGIMDGEGWVSYSPHKHGRKIGIANTDPVLIERIEEALTVLGIGYCKGFVEPRQAHHKPKWVIQIVGKANLTDFYNWVPFQAPAKVQRLYDAITSYKNRVPSDRPGLGPVLPPMSGGSLLSAKPADEP